MSIKIKAKIKINIQVFPKKNDVMNKENPYRIFNASPIGDVKGLKLNNRFEFSIKGEYPYLDEDGIYDVELEELDTTKWSTNYKVLEVFNFKELKNLTRQESENILSKMASENNTKTLLDTYPNFIEKVLTEGKESIDTSKLYNIKEKKLNSYCRQINEKFKYYSIMSKFKDYELTMKECQKLCDVYKTTEDIAKAIQNNPYFVLIDVLDRNFLYEKNNGELDGVDTMLIYGKKNKLPLREDLKESEIRCEYLMLKALDDNEKNTCSTRQSGNDLWEYTKDYAPELVPLMKKVATECDGIYYDEPTTDMAKMSTYLGEVKIAKFVNMLLDNDNKLDWDWSKFTTIKDGELTEEQQELLRQICEHRIVIMDAGAGCVDCDTEYFNGEEWEKISEYKDGDKVLQYDMNGNATLVNPIKYIKEPCNHLWHFETKYGLSQTLSDEHIVPYYTPNNVFKEKTLSEIKDIQEKMVRGFKGRFITTFNYDGNGIDLTDNEIKIMCAVICDGSFYYNRQSKEEVEHRDSYKTCRFHIKKDRKKIALRELFKESNIEYREYKSAKEGYVDFYIQAPRREKEFTSYWYNCSQHQLQVICDNLIQWDGSVNTTKNGVVRKSFSTNVKQTADFVQFAYSSCGYRASLFTRDRRGRIKVNKENGKEYIDKSIEYEVNITNKILCGITKDKRVPKNDTKFKKIIPIDGYKYCFQVPSHMLVLRKDDKIFITGNCGKSSAMMAVLQMIEHYHLTYQCMTATGKSSKRLSEQTNRPCSTIHLIKLRNGGTNATFIIVDEDSFLSVELTTMIIDCILEEDNVRIILSGDCGQIPSISAGRIIRDMIDCGKIPIVSLTKCFRFGEGGKATVSTKCRNGEFYIEDSDIEKDIITYGKNKDYTFVKFDGTMEQIINIYEKTINKEKCKPSDIWVLTPWNIREFGAINISNKIQALINPPVEGEKTFKITRDNQDIIFRENDLVLNLVNKYDCISDDMYEEMLFDDSLAKSDYQKELLSCMNGEIGKILYIDDKVMKILFDENILVFDKNDINNLSLAYSINIFKAQGSQNKHIITLTIPEHKKSLNRQLQYTALTRATDTVTEIGDISTMKEAVNKIGDDKRKTFLLELLKENSDD